MLLSSLYKKPIIECHSACDLGYASKIHINATKIDYILTTKDIKISTANIIKINDGIIYNSECRNYPNFNFFAVDAQNIVGDNGKIYGKLVDIMLDANFEIKKLITNNKNLCSVEILNMSDQSLLIKRIPKCKKSAVIPQTDSGINPAAIVTTISNYAFLIGRVVQKDIKCKDLIIIPAGKKITKPDIDLAQKYGKLIDITIYSKEYNIQNL